MSFIKVLHHTYRTSGTAVDVSGHENHGTPRFATLHADGRKPHSGALGFGNSASDVVVPHSASLSEISAIRIDAWINLQASGGPVPRRTIIDGHNSFSLYINNDNSIGAHIRLPSNAPTPIPGPGANPQTTLTPNLDPSPNSQLLMISSRAAFAPDGNDHHVPESQWRHVRLLHDGLSTLSLFLDGTLVGFRNDATHPMAQVGPAGLRIGHHRISPWNFRGLIDDVQIWIPDPRQNYTRFLCRTMPFDVRRCWSRQFYEIYDLLATNDEVGQLGVCVQRSIRRLVQAAMAKSPTVAAGLRRLGGDYEAAWCAGEVANERMLTIVDSIVEVLEAEAGEELQQFRDEITACVSDTNLNPLRPAAEETSTCDPEAVSLLGHLADRSDPTKPYSPRYNRKSQ